MTAAEVKAGSGRLRPTTVLLVVALTGLLAVSPSAARAPAATPSFPVAERGYGNLPLAFVPNAGQTDARVRFSVQARGASFHFTPTEAVFAFSKPKKGTVLRLAFLGANPRPTIEGLHAGAGTVNYLLGNDRSSWRTGLPTYQRIVYRDLWPGVDLVFRGAPGRLKYEFLLYPGARAADIRLGYRGAKRLSVGRGGDLRIRTALGVLRDRRPRTYQEIGGRRVRVESRFAVSGRTYGFALGAYDRSRPLVIDPDLAYSTFLGGELEQIGFGIAADHLGNAYVGGFTSSSNFPVTAGAFDTTAPGGGDVFVTKLNQSGSALVYSTFIGGSDFDTGSALALDSMGNTYLTGVTASPDFPVTAGAFDTTDNPDGDAFVAKLNADGSDLVYSTYLGGGVQDGGDGIAVDPQGDAYVTGTTTSSDFPATAGALRTTFGGELDAFVTKLSSDGSTLDYSTYLGGGGFDQGIAIAVSPAGSAYLTGVTGSDDFPISAGAFDPTRSSFDAFVTKLATDGAALDYSTFLGGTSFERGFGIAVSPAGNAYVTGDSGSADFPVTPGAVDPTHNGVRSAFLTKLDTAGSALVYSTYLSGSTFEQGFGIDVDGAGHAYVTGASGSADFPVTPDAFDTTFNGAQDAFVTKLDTDGSALAYSTYLGGTATDVGHAIAVVPSGDIYVTGETSSADFSVTPGAYDTTINGLARDVFVAKLSAH